MNLCHRGRDSSIVFLFLGYNQLTGSLNVSQCGSLSFIDVTVSGGIMLLASIFNVYNVYNCSWALFTSRQYS